MSSVAVDSLAYLPPEIRDMLKEVVFTCMHNSSGISSSLIELISETNRDPKGAELLNQMLSSGRLKGWLQGIVTNSIESKLKALEIIDDFKYLLGTAATGADQVFEKVSNLSERKIKSQTKDSQSRDQSLQEVSSIVRMLHSNYQRGEKSESSFNNSIDKYESQEQFVPIQQVLSKYGTEPLNIKHHEPLRTSFLPIIELVSFKCKPLPSPKNQPDELPFIRPIEKEIVAKIYPPSVSSKQLEESASKQQTSKIGTQSSDSDRNADVPSKLQSNTGQTKSNSSLGGSTQTDSKQNLVTQIQIGVVESNNNNSKTGISKEDLMKPLDLKRDTPKKPKKPSTDETETNEAKPTISVLAPKTTTNHEQQIPNKVNSPLVFDSMQSNTNISKHINPSASPISPSNTSSDAKNSDQTSIPAIAISNQPQQQSNDHTEIKQTPNPEQQQKTFETPHEQPLSVEPFAPMKLTQKKDINSKRSSKNESIKKTDSFEYEDENPTKNPNNKFEDSFGVHNHSFDKKSDNSLSKQKKPDYDSFEDPVRDNKKDNKSIDEDADSYLGSDLKEEHQEDKSIEEIELEKLDRSNASIDKPQFGTPDRKKEPSNTLGVKTPDKVQSKFEDSFYSVGSDENKKAESNKPAPPNDTDKIKQKNEDSFNAGSDDELSFGSDEPKPEKKPSADNYDFDEDLDFLREEQQEEENRRMEEKRKKIEEENRRAEEKRRLEEEKIRKAIEDRKKREEDQKRREQEAEEEEKRIREKKKRDAEEAQKRLLKEEEKRKKKEYLEILDAKKKDAPKTPQQLALRLGRTVEPLPDQGRKYKPKKFEMPSPSVAKTYLSDYSITRIELPESSP